MWYYIKLYKLLDIIYKLSTITKTCKWWHFSYPCLKDIDDKLLIWTHAIHILYYLKHNNYANYLWIFIRFIDGKSKFKDDVVDIRGRWIKYLYLKKILNKDKWMTVDQDFFTVYEL